MNLRLTPAPMTEPEIERARERVRGGNIEDYRTIVAAYHQRLRGAVAGLCPPGVEADEIAQLSFIEAFRNLNRYEAGTNFFSWLCAIARNRLLAECKRIQRQSRNQQSYLNRVISERLLILCSEQTELNDVVLQFLRACVAELNLDVREIIEQRYS